MRRLLPAILSLILIFGCASYLFLNHKKAEPEPERSAAYIASADTSVMIYYREDKLLYEYMELIRGTEVTDRNIEIEVNDGEFMFTQIELDGHVDNEGNPAVYYIPSDALRDSVDDVVLEKTRYVRTPVTVYADPDSCRISSFLKKGTELNITGYAGLREDGTVEMYRVGNEGSEGYVYSKYLTTDEDSAYADYTQTASVHAGREYTFDLYGGHTENLDWYPVDKPQLASGPVLDDARAMYISAYALNPDYIQDYIDLALASGVNAMVVDIKDGVLAYTSDTASSLSPSSYASALYTDETFGSSIRMIQDAGLYVIGRIVVFNDSNYAADHPEECIVSDVTDQLWPSAYSRNCWYYNAALAVESVEKFGFNEIQFDYVRFPETAYEMSESESTDSRNTYNEEKAQAIQNFCFYVCDKVHEAGAYVSIDVFGECVEQYVTAYGQYWPAISNVADVISGMPYTDHFGSEKDTWSHPYTTVYEWAVKAALRQTEIKTPAIVRTWITGYDTPNWNPYMTYGSAQLIDQAQALVDSGLTGGFIPWHGSSDYYKYSSYSDVWSYNYQREQSIR
ncbi:MAG: hypothetical protein HUJ76_05915 [Parasporobacterium sp.]|nr:hypothetical protein [Parasporobacterium sp.]